MERKYIIEVKNGEIESSNIPAPINMVEGKITLPTSVVKPLYYICVGEDIDYTAKIVFKDNNVTLTTPKCDNFNVIIGGY